jgi:hypothetical protein
VSRRALLALCFCLTIVAAVPYDGIGAAAYMRKYANFNKAGHDGCRPASTRRRGRIRCRVRQARDSNVRWVRGREEEVT